MEKYRDLFCRLCCGAAMFLCAVALLGLTKWGLSYISFMGEDELVGFYEIALTDRLWGVAAIAVAAAVLGWLARGERVMRAVTAAGVCLTAGQALFWLWCTKAEPFADSLFCLQAAQGAVQGDWSAFQQGGYMYRYPFQSGLVALEEAVLRLAGSWDAALIWLRWINFLALMLLAVSVCRIAFHLFGPKAQMVTSVLLACSVPVARYVFFLYGNLLSTALGFAAVWTALRWLDTRKARFGLISAGLLAAAMTIKSTALIMLVAIAIVAVLDSIRTGRWRQLLAVAAAVVFAFLPGKGFQYWYSLRSGVPVQPGTATVVWLVMGLDSRPEQYEFAPGWHTADKRSEKAYENAGFDYERMKQEQTQELKEQLRYWVNNPSQAKTFLRQKTVSQWLDPGFGSWLYLRRNTEPVHAQDYQEQLFAQSWNEGLNPFLGCLQTVVYLLGLVGAVRLMLRPSPASILPALVFFGGVFYLTLSEGKSQYAVSFYPMLLPVAALGAGTLQAGCGLLAARVKKRIVARKNGA